MARLISKIQVNIEDPTGQEEGFVVTAKIPPIAVMDDLAELLAPAAMDFKKLLKHPEVIQFLKAEGGDIEALAKPENRIKLITAVADVPELLDDFFGVDSKELSARQIEAARLIREHCYEPQGLLDDAGQPLSWDEVEAQNPVYYRDCLLLVARAVLDAVRGGAAKEREKNSSSSSVS